MPPWRRTRAVRRQGDVDGHGFGALVNLRRAGHGGDRLDIRRRARCVSVRDVLRVLADHWSLRSGKLLTSHDRIGARSVTALSCHIPARLCSPTGRQRILIVGSGYAGFYAAWKLEKRLRASEAALVVVDPRPYLTCQPFLPEVLAGSVEARHAAVSTRRHLRRTRLIAGRVTASTTRTTRWRCAPRPVRTSLPTTR